MKIIIYFILFFCQFSLYAFDLSFERSFPYTNGHMIKAAMLNEQWDNEFDHTLSLTCSKSESLRICRPLCNDNVKCFLTLPYCEDCIGSDPVMNFLFTNVGLTILNSHKKIQDQNLLDLLRRDDVTILSGKSAFNSFESYSSFEQYERFKSLCFDKTEEPLLFVELIQHRLTLKPIAVWCKSGFFEVEVTY